MESLKAHPLPMFDLDDQGHVRLHWARPEGALHGLLTLDEALDLQFELAAFLAQVERGAAGAGPIESVGAGCAAGADICECSPVAAVQDRLLN